MHTVAGVRTTVWFNELVCDFHLAVGRCCIASLSFCQGTLFSPCLSVVNFQHLGGPLQEWLHALLSPACCASFAVCFDGSPSHGTEALASLGAARGHHHMDAIRWLQPLAQCSASASHWRSPTQAAATASWMTLSPGWHATSSWPCGAAGVIAVA